MLFSQIERVWIGDDLPLLHQQEQELDEQIDDFEMPPDPLPQSHSTKLDRTIIQIKLHQYFRFLYSTHTK